ncbi:hypothetical protein JOC77_004236 [Peribacillus deserti]|uniref:DNA-binding protein n=1 Tax=Peribacillus deserti TaxID=673318 RepID=A0ABS2QPZ4_9BACI|nr:hypothetical protein [Peribacillus deserti]MBM7694759.1 hypothetical protein [Peribacillus deserti]
MRKIYGIQNLIVYLASAGYPLTEKQVHELILNKDIPHLRPINNMIVFNLDHIDWWVSQRLKL